MFEGFWKSSQATWVVQERGLRVGPFQTEKAKMLERTKHACLGDVLGRASPQGREQVGGECEAASREASLCLVPDSSVGRKRGPTPAHRPARRLWGRGGKTEGMPGVQRTSTGWRTARLSLSVVERASTEQRLVLAGERVESLKGQSCVDTREPLKVPVLQEEGSG